MRQKKSFKGTRCRQFTFERRETTVQDQFEIAKLSLAQDDGGKSLGLGGELIVSGSIPGKEILEDTAVRWVGHRVSV